MGDKRVTCSEIGLVIIQSAKKMWQREPVSLTPPEFGGPDQRVVRLESVLR